MILSINPTDIIAIAIILLIIGGAIFYIIKAKKNGVKCIGCPHGKTCKSNQNKVNSCSSCGSGCSCCSQKETEAE